MDTSQGTEIVSVHLYGGELPQFGITGHMSAEFMPIFKHMTDDMQKYLFIGEFADTAPEYYNVANQAEDLAAVFTRNVLAQIQALRVPYSAPWIWEFYHINLYTYYDSQSSGAKLEPSYTPVNNAAIRQTNINLGNAVVPLQSPDITPPIVVLTWPVDSVTLEPQQKLYAVASDNNMVVSKVEFWVDGELVNTDTVAPYEYVLNTNQMTAGTHTIMAKAYDPAANSSEYSTIVNGGALTASITAVPSPCAIGAGQSVCSSAIKWTTTGYPAANVFLRETGQVFGASAVSLPDGNIAPWIGIAGVTFDLREGPSVTSNLLASVYVRGVDVSSPSVSISYPANSATVSGPVTVLVSASDNLGVTKTELYIDGVLTDSKLSSPYNFSVNTVLLSNAAHTLIARAYDSAGNMTISPTITITVDNTVVPPVTTDPPLGLSISSITYYQCTVSWTPPGSVNIAGYLIDVAENSIFSRFTWYESFPVNNASSVTISGLLGSGVYYVHAHSKNGSGYVSPASSTLQINTPAKPVDRFMAYLTYPAAGGDFADPLTNSRIVVPADAFTMPVTLSLRSYTLPASARAVTPVTVYELEPSDAQLLKPIALTLPYIGQVAAVMQYFNPVAQAWQTLNDSRIDWTAHTITAQAEHMGRYGIVAVAQNPDGLKIIEGFVYPNPVKGNTAPKIHAKTNLAAEKVEVKIYNIAGEYVGEQTLVNPVAQAGAYIFEAALDSASKIASGTYIIIMRAYSSGKKTSPLRGKFAIIK